MKPIAITVLFLLVVGVSGFSMYKWLAEVIASSSWTTQIVGNSFLSEDEILRLIGARDDARRGRDSLRNFNLEAAQQRLNALPIIKRAVIKRIYPSTLSVQIEERKAVAWLEAKNLGIEGKNCPSAYFIDYEGFTWKCNSDFSKHKMLPVVSCSSLRFLRDGERIDDKACLASLRVMAEMSLLDEFSDWHVIRAEAPQDYAFELLIETPDRNTTNPRTISVGFLSVNIAEQVKRLREIARIFHQSGSIKSYVDLRVPNLIAIENESNNTGDRYQASYQNLPKRIAAENFYQESTDVKNDRELAQEELSYVEKKPSAPSVADIFKSSM